MDPVERRVVIGFSSWHHLRRLRAAATQQPITYDQMKSARNDIAAAVELIAWLRAHGTTLATCSQLEIDRWLIDGPWRRHIATTFLRWAVANKHASGVKIPYPVRQGRSVLGNDERWNIVRKLLNDDTIDSRTRVAGLLCLLLAQPVSRISRLTVDQVRQTGDTVTLALGSKPFVLPPPLDALVLQLLPRRRGFVSISSNDDNTPWLFAGRTSGQPLSAKQIHKNLLPFGFRSRAGRHAALMSLAAELPAAVISDLLGIKISHANAWAHEAGQRQSGYAAALSRTGRF